MTKREIIKGIQNVTGVSCHISSALQVICHILVPISNAVQLYSSSSSSSHSSLTEDEEEHLSSTLPSSTDDAFSLLFELGRFFCMMVSSSYTSESSDGFEENEEDQAVEEEMQHTSIDPTNLYESLRKFTSLNPEDVGDASLALNKLLNTLRKIVSNGDDDVNGNDWKRILDICVFGGQTKQVIFGMKRTKEEDSKESRVTIRIKKNNNKKAKSLPCPLPLVGKFQSIEEAIELVWKPIQVNGYNWDTVQPENYVETSINDENQHPVVGITATASTADPTTNIPAATSDDDDDEKWVTYKQIQLLNLPMFLIFDVERYHFMENNGIMEKVITNPFVAVSEIINISSYTTTTATTTATTTTAAAITTDMAQEDGIEENDNNQNELYELKGGIIHVLEDDCKNQTKLSGGGEEEEVEGHYVTILFDGITKIWYLLDDEKCTRIKNQQRAIELLSGTTTDDSDGTTTTTTTTTTTYFGTLLLYRRIQNDDDDDEWEEIITCTERLKAKISERIKMEQEAIRRRRKNEDTISSSSEVVSTNPQDLIGKRLKVRWSKGKFYPGIVDSYDMTTGKHRIVYDDGDVREYILSKKTIEWL